MLNFSTTAGGWLGHFPGKTAKSDRAKPVQQQTSRTVEQVRPAQVYIQTITVEVAPVIAAIELESPTGQPDDRSVEARLIALAQTGDQAAFAELVEMHQDFVFNLAFRILQNYEEADDASQEAFVKIWQALPGFRGDSKFTTWAYRIVRNSCLNRLRSIKGNPRLVSVETSFEDGDEGETDILANLPGDQTEEPAWRFDTNERRQLIWEAVDQLPIKYREIIALYYNQELSYEEIAAALEVPVGTVKTHLYRAKAQLKSRLQELSDRGAIDFGN